MNKKLLIPIIILFLAANITTYLFASGKIKPLERFASACIDKENGRISPIDMKETVRPIKQEKAAASIGKEGSGRPLIGFNDTDYFVPGDNSNKEPAVITTTLNNAGEKTAPKDAETKADTAIIAAIPMQVYEPTIENASAAPYNNIPALNRSPDDPKITPGENIPTPELPPFGNEEPTSEENSDIQLPQLPEIS